MGTFSTGVAAGSVTSSSSAAIVLVWSEASDTSEEQLFFLLRFLTVLFSFAVDVMVSVAMIVDVSASSGS